MDGLAGNDTATLAGLMDPSLVHVDPQGAAHRRDAVLEAMRAIPAGTAMTVTVEDVSLRRFGDTAVAVGLTRLSVDHPGGRAVRRYRFTDVFVRRPAGWRIVSTHTSAVAEAAP